MVETRRERNKQVGSQRDRKERQLKISERNKENETGRVEWKTCNEETQVKKRETGTKKETGKKETETDRESKTCGNDKTALNNLLNSVSVPKV